jgi:endonuclease YncB( thermonuclease family)
MRTIERFKREVGGMSSSAWALFCGCCFIIALGASLGLLSPQRPATPSAAAPAPADVIRYGMASRPEARPSGAVSFSKCRWSQDACVIDGDTFRFNGQTVRIADIDAPETGGAKCPEEAALGGRATTRLAEILSSAPFILQTVGSRDEDQYGRKLRIVILNGQSIGNILVNEGLARTWTGRRRPWC